MTFTFTEGFCILIYRPQYYKLIEECVSQIVLQRSGIDPDFRYTRKFEIDVDLLTGELVLRMERWCVLMGDGF